MKTTSKVDAAIIGAGPVGMALACELIRHGLGVRIVDMAATTKSNSRAPVFWPRAQDALDLMGVHHLWDGKTVPMRRMNVNLYGRPAAVVQVDAGESAYPTPMLVGQDVTEGLLDGHLSSLGTAVERSTEAIDIALGDDGATITIRKGDGAVERFAASWVVGCEGAASLVRTKAGIGWEGRQLRGVMVPVADAQQEWTLPKGDGDAYVTLTDNGYLLAIPLPGMWRVIVATPDTTPDDKKPAITPDEVARLAAAAIGGPVLLSEAAWVAVVRYGNHIAPTFRHGCAFLAGDAAHAIAPLSGQGMNTGVQDAFDLGWKLAYVHKGWAHETLLDSYSADRRPVSARLVRTTNRFFDNVIRPGKLQKRLVRTIAPLILKLARVREQIAGFYTETDVAYPASPLNDRYDRRSPRPGEHVKDGSLVTWPDLRNIRLYDVLRGLHWTTIAFSGANPREADLQRLRAGLDNIIQRFGSDRVHGLLIVGRPTATGLTGSDALTVTVDAWRSLHDKYDAASGAILLVRPDGYISSHRFAQDRDFAAITNLLSRVIGSAPW